MCSEGGSEAGSEGCAKVSIINISASPAGIKKVNHVEWGKKEGRIED